jgi:hypothetical protein
VRVSDQRSGRNYHENLWPAAVGERAGRGGLGLDECVGLDARVRECSAGVDHLSIADDEHAARRWKASVEMEG